MKKISLGILTVLWSVCSCAQVPAKPNTAQGKNVPNGNIEKFDVKKFNRGQSGGDYLYKDKAGNEVQMSGDAGSDYVSTIKLAKPSLFTSYKVYDGKTLIIKEKGTLLYNVPVGSWIYYNTDGSVNKQVDEDKKFGRFGPAQLSTFLQKEKLVNLKTGAGREYLQTVNFGTEKLDPKVRHSWGAPDKGQWSVIYTKSTPLIDHTYIIDSQTGRLVSHKNLKGEELVR
jgi:hypothetical protein